MSADVEAWRLQILLDAGYPIAQAELLAAARHVDLHYAVELVTVRKCDPVKAAAILL
jgi:hypothetical protein